MNKKIVFDLDGTLLSCEEKQKFVLYSIIKSLRPNEEFNNERLNYWWNLKRNGMSTERALITMGFPSARKVSEQWRRIIEENVWSYLDSPYSDSLLTLKLLQSYHMLEITILTARKNGTQVQQSLYRFGFINFIDEYLVVDPYSVVFEKAMVLKKIRPLLYVGDTESDYQAARESGVRFIALSRGQRSRSFLKSCGIDQIFDNLKFINNNGFINQFTQISKGLC
jgi:phosphoglycolate phosphatase-like HAD superfamily hydrolase